MFMSGSGIDSEGNDMNSQTTFTTNPHHAWRFRTFGRILQWLFCLPLVLASLATVSAQQTNLAVVVRHAPNLNGSGLIEGSVQQLLGEGVTLNGGFTMAGDLLVPGTPTILQNGNPTFGGTIVGSGSSTPTGYQVTLNGNCSLHYLRTRTTPVAIPTVSAPPPPGGARTVNINSAGQAIGDPATLRHLTLNGNVGQYVIPPGTYGNFIANGGSGFTIGVVGATNPAIYNLQNLTLNGQSRLDVVGPVILTVANGFTANGVLGATNNPSRLQLQLVSGGFTLNGGCTVYGNVTAPAGTVIINGNSLLVGMAKCDRLIVNSGGIIRAGTTVNQAPAANSQNLSVAEDGTLNLALTGSDAEGAALTYTVLSQPGHGSLSGAVPNLTYAPGANFNGSDSFTFKVNDGQADSATATISITVMPVNDAPTAQSQTGSTPEDVSLSVTLSGSDVENSPLTFQIITSPAHGSLTGTAPNLSYTPTANYSGPDSFTYKTGDGQLQSAVATVSITVNPVDDAPVAANQTVTTDEDVAANITLTAVDVEGDGLDFAVLTQPAQGTLSGTPPNLIYTPATNYNGSDNFTFRASDAWLDSAPATITLVVRPVNDAPVATEQTIITLEDAATNLLLTATDVDGDTLSFTLVANPADGTLNGTAPALIFSPAANFHGTNTFSFVAVDGNATSAPVAIALVVMPVNDLPVAEAKIFSLNEDTAANIVLTGTDVDGDALTFIALTQPTNGVLSGTAPNLAYTPNTNFAGTDYFTYEVNDGTSNSTPAAVTLTIQPVNDAPFADDQPVTTDEDTAATITLTGSDVENDALTLAVVVQPAHGTLTPGSEPSTFNYQPSTNYSGPDSFTFVANDSQTNSPTATISITVNPLNDAPTAIPATVNTSEDASVAVTLAGADVDGDTLTFTVATGPAHGSLSGTAPNLIYTPAPNYFGSDQFNFTANDGTTNSQPAVVGISVATANDAPVVNPQSLVTDENIAISITLTGSDVDGDALIYSVETQPGHGTLSGVAPNLTYTPATDFDGIDAFTFLASDGVMDSTSASVFITVRRVNHAPFVNAGSDQTNNVLTFTLTGVVTDDGLPLGSNLTSVWSKVSGPGTVTFSDNCALTNDVSFSQSGVYVLRLTADDGEHQATDELIILANLPPVVDAGSNQVVTVGDEVLLTGNVSDDGLPSTNSLTTLWTLENGAGVMELSGPTNAVTMARFMEAGIYILRLTASDTFSTNSATVTIQVNSQNRVPTVTVGPKQLVVLPAVASLQGVIIDDGLPVGGSLTAQWTKISGPGEVAFDFSTATNTTASFAQAGDYVIRLSANDSALTGYADLRIAVRTPAMNEPPILSAGNNKVIGLTNVVTLEGVATDDGLPQGGSLGVTWSVVSGPGAVTFENSNATNSRATFASVGDYVLRLTATDSQLSRSSEVAVSVYPHNQPPVVDAGPDQAIIIPTPSLLVPSGATPNAANVELATSLADVPHWDNSIGQPGLDSWVYRNSIAIGDSVFVTGLFQHAGDKEAHGSARWNGSEWFPLYDPRPHLYDNYDASITNIAYFVYDCGTFYFCNQTLDCVGARGQEAFVGGLGKNLAYSDSLKDPTARWSGTGWESWTYKWHGGQLPRVIIARSNMVYLGGGFIFQPTNATDQVLTNLPKVTGIATWDGTNWGTLGAGLTNIDYYNPEVYSMAVTSNGKVYAGGVFRMPTANGLAQGIIHWNGTNWLALDAGITGGLVSHDIWGLPYTNSPKVSALALAENGDLYAAGAFTHAGGQRVNGIARWDGTRWWPLNFSSNSGINGEVEALAVHGRDLYVGGNFTDVGGVTAWRIAQYDGQFWRSLGQGTSNGSSNGVYGQVLSLAVDDTGLYVGGIFSKAGGQPANNIAKWVFPRPPTQVAYLNGKVTDDGLPTGAALTATWTKASGPGAVNFVNPHNPVTTATFSEGGTYILELRASDTEYTVLDQATIVVQTNAPPVVSAGTNQVASVGALALLSGSVSDDGLPAGVSVATLWSVVKGPGPVQFENAGAPQTTAQFSAAGTYVLRLSANDSQFTSFADITVIVLPANSAPGVQALAWRNFGWFAGYYWEGQAFMPTPLPLGANVGDDQRPSNILVSAWSQVSGPGQTLFDDSHSIFTSAVFTEPGTYVLRLTVSDTELTSFSDIVVDVFQGGQFNQTPRVWAGNDQHITLPATATLAAQAVDDGPQTNLTFNWRMANGPGAVIFADSSAATTTASFSRAGTYELAVDVSDGNWWSSGSDSVLIIVAPETGVNRAPLVSAGPPQTGVIHLPVSLGGIVVDDGLPAGVTVTSTWSLLEGPAPGTFANSNAAQTTVTCDTVGDYLFQLTVSDTELVSTNTVLVRIVDCEPDNLPPVVNAGPDQTLTDSYVYLPGAVSDDGKTGGAFEFVWSQVSGPLPASFYPYSLDNWVGLPVPGKYVFRLLAQDGSYGSGDDVIIERQTAVVANQAPVVDAGPPQTLLLPTNQVTLSGLVTDDSGSSLTYHWEVSSAWGEVVFDDPNSLTPTVTFPNPPIDYDYGYPAYYDLRLVAEDGENYSSSALTIIVGDTNVSQGALYVDAGPDQTLTIPQTATLTAQTEGFDLYWTQVSGPVCSFQGGGGGSTATATAVSAFSVVNATSDAQITFATPGVYRFRCIANGWNAIGADEIVITVLAASNLPPTVVAGPPRTLVVPTDSVVLAGLAIDDGYPPNAPLTSHWEVVTAPAGGTATLAQPDQLVTTASFSLPGSYTLRLTVSDSEFTVSNETTITLAVPVCVTNLPPVVDAGADATATMLELFTLNGTVSDDGFPLNGLSQSWSVISGPVNPDDPGAGVGIWYPNQAVTPVTFAYPGIYVLRLTATDGSLTNADDITITVDSTTNTAPQVFAGYAQLVNRGEPVQLSGLVWDDGIPTNCTVQWAVLGDPASAVFTNPNVTNVVVTFPALGQYTLRLTANDSVLSGYSDVVITVTVSTNGNYPPQITTGGEITATTYRSVNLPGYVSDDGLPTNGHLITLWGQLNGPGTVRFGNALQTNTPAAFYTAGTYTLQLIASDSQLSAGASLTVTVNDPTNEPPLVYAGGNLVVTRPAAAELEGYVLDDDQPLGYPLLFQWSKVSGPGTVTFTTSSNVAPNVTPWQEVDSLDVLAFASFSTNGTYVLRLTGTDTQYTNTDEVTITVLPSVNSAPSVWAGPDQAISLPYPAILYTDVTDDGLENGAVQISWSKVSGPGAVSFSTINGVYRAAFTTTGDYVLRLAANDGALSATDDVAVTVYDVPAPLAEINSPLDAGVITAPTLVVGTASSAILQSYVLEYRLAPPDSLPAGGEGQGEVAWSVLSSNTVSVVSNTLAVFDPTLLLNGIYELRLTATDVAGRSTVTEPITLIVDRNLKIGLFTVSFNDLAVPVPGLPLQITRTYDSRAAAAGIQGDFGIGWTLDIRNVRLQKNRSLSRNWEQTVTGSPWDLSLAYHLNGGKPRIVTITFPDGRVEKFQFVPNPMDQALLPIEYPQWRFIPLGNTRGSLVPAGYDDPDGRFIYFAGSIPGTADLYDLNYFTDWLFGSGTEEDLLRHPTLFRYSTPEGYKYLIDEIAGLQSVTDPNGNTLLISTNGLTWTNSLSAGGEGQGEVASLSIAFQRDTQGRITNIVDAAGHTMTYAYNNAGDLITYTDRVGQTNGFAYTNTAFPHHLTGITDPFGVIPLSTEYDASGRLVRNTDVYGGVIQYVHDITNLTTSVTDRNGSQITQEFDDEGNLVRAVDALGGVTTCTYDGEGRRLSRTNPLGENENYTYNPTNGALIALVNALGQTNTFTYSTNGQVTQATERDGTSLFADYDSRNNVTRVVDTLGNPTVYAYNSAGKAIYSRDALGNEVRSSYDASGNLTRATNALGNVSEFSYDANNRITLQVLTRTTNGITQRLTNSWVYDSAGRVTAAIAPDGTMHQTIYDAAGHIAATIDELGRATTNRYDLLGRLVQVIYPDGSTEGYAYDSGDRKIATTNRLGQVMRYLYDALNRPVITIFPDGSGTTNYFNAASRLIATTDARGNSTWFGHDSLGRVIATTNALGEVTTFAYDARGNQITSTDALGRTTTNVFDLANRLVAMLYADGTTTSNRYDALGRKIAETDQLGRVTQFSFDALGRLVALTNALNQVTRYEYNELGEQTAQVDASGRITRYEYDERGRRVSRILPLGQADFATYDALGNMTAYRDFNGNVTGYQYDSLNRLTQKRPDSRLGEPSVLFAYNLLGQRTNMVDASGVTSCRYDERNRLIEKATPQGMLTYTYDANGNVTSIQSSNTNGVSVTYEHDALNRLSAVNDANLGRSAYTYDAAGNLRGFTYPNFVHHEYSYDALNRLTNVAGSRLLDSLVSYAYALAPNGQRTSATESHGRVVNYAYDLLNRLSTETVSGVVNPGSASYSYDAVGNRLARNSNLPGILASSYAYDDNDRLLSDIYDNNGNTRTASLVDPLSLLPQPVADQYDFENRLIDRNNGQIRVVYDGDGNRVRKTITTATNTVTTYYLVDNLNPTGYPQVLEELTSNSQLLSPAVTRVYVWGHALISQDRMDDFGWTESYYGYDGQTSVRYLTDRNGNITDTYDFDAFGNLTHRTGSTPNNYLYQGEQYDSDLKLYYLRARYADPDRGRFWTQDSFEGFGSDPASLHKYTFNHNDPVNRRDPSGHFSLSEQMTVNTLAPTVRGSLQAMQQSMLMCRMQSAAMASAVGGAIGGTVNVYITRVIQAFTGEFNREELMKAFSEGFADGSMAGLAMGFSPFTAGAFMGYSAFMAGMDFWRDWNDPSVPMWVKYMEGANVVASLVAIMPSVAKKLNQMLQMFCFPAGTEVSTATGQKPIEQIQEGDLVWAQDDRTGELSLKPVKQLFVNVATALVVLHCGTNTLEATPEHPLWVADEGWKAAGQVQVGDELWTRSGKRIAVTDIGHKQGQFTVFNFEVEDAHTYFVGKQQVLGHNAGPCNVLLKKAQSYYSRIRINMNGAPASSAVNSAGYPRNFVWFWEQVSVRNPEMLSAENLLHMRLGTKGYPKVDEQWLLHNPQHAEFKNQQLIHHHIDQGSHATAIPVGVHREYHGVLHPDKGPN
jgi:RHS repeat-associated protein